MKRKFIYMARVFLFFIFLLPQTGLAQIVINEIGAYETSDKEWVEIYNTGDESVDLTGWKFWENATNHGLTAFQGDFMIEPHEYAIIAQKADAFLADKNFSGTILDSVWSSFSLTGEEIGLKNSSGTPVEIFTYPAAASTSLERASSTLADYTGTNWQSHMTGHTAGAQNSNVVTPAPAEIAPEPPAPNPELTPVETSPEEVPTSTPEIIEPVVTPAEATLGPSDVVINEFVSDPKDGEDEWVEIFNRTENEISLTGWTLEEGSGASTLLDATLAPHGFYVIPKPKGSLNNSGDIIILKNPMGQIFDSITYGNWANSLAPVAADPNAVARRETTFEVTSTPTPGTENIFTEIQSLSENGSSSAVQATVAYSPSVILNEIFPNPSGGQEEFIEIINAGTGSVNLENWKLGDATTKRFILKNLTLAPGEIKSFPRSVTNIALNNTDTEEVRLFWPNSQVASFITYEDAPKNKSYILTDDGAWAWSDTTTPDQKNIFVHVNEPPELHWSCPKSAEVGEIITCDATDSTDDQNDVKFFWDFGDGRTDTQASVRQIYTRAGSYKILLALTDSLGLTATASQKISIKALPTETPDEPEERIVSDGRYFPPIFISEFLPNPKGPDEPGEFIELFNPNEFAVDLSDWSLDDSEGGSKPYVIPSDTVIEAQSYKLFSRDETHLSLNNTHDAARLLTPAGIVMEDAQYEKSSEGVSLIRTTQGTWGPTALSTPNELNVANTVVETPKKKTLTISEALELDLDTKTTLRARITALPETLGSHIAYVADDSAGIQLYFFQSRWPEVKLDDEVVITGTLSSIRGEPRFKITSAEDISVVGHATTSQSKIISTTNITDIPAGIVTTLEGEVIEKKSDGFFVADESGDIFVNVKSGLHIPLPAVNSHVTVSGIFINPNNEPRILLRSATDLQIAEILAAEHTETIKPLPELSAPTRQIQPIFITSILGAAGVLATRFLIRKKKSSG